MPNISPYGLSETGKYLLLKTEANFQYHNDGVFGHDETAWGNHLTNFEADHGEVIGIYGEKRAASLKVVKEVVTDWEKRHAATKISTQA